MHWQSYPSKIEGVLDRLQTASYHLSECFLLFAWISGGWLDNFQSVHVCIYITSSGVPKPCLEASKKMWKSVVASTQPWLTKLRITKDDGTHSYRFEKYPSYCYGSTQWDLAISVGFWTWLEFWISRSYIPDQMFLWYQLR